MSVIAEDYDFCIFLYIKFTLFKSPDCNDTLCFIANRGVSHLKHFDHNQISYLSWCHVRDGSMRLHCFKLVQTPVHFVQCLTWQSCIVIFWKIFQIFWKLFEKIYMWFYHSFPSSNSPGLQLIYFGFTYRHHFAQVIEMLWMI